MPATALELTQRWQWKQRDPHLGLADDIGHIDSWTNTHAFPSEIHVELLKAGKIPDPYLAFNEHQVQWIGEKEWMYRCVFPFDAKPAGTTVDLQFDGLDTFCDVYLNDELLLSTDNMFRTYIHALDSARLKATDNVLVLHFKSAKLIATELERNFGKVRAGSTNLGDPSRVYVRKAQYDWRWDWGPELMTCGPYRPIRLVAYTARLDSVHARASVSSDLSASLGVDLHIAGNFETVKAIRVRLSDTAGNIVKEETAAGVDAKESLSDVVKWQLSDSVKLWWPVGYGTQQLYDVDVQLLGKNDVVLDTRLQRIGFRRIELVQEALAEADQYGTGTSFFFRVNNVSVFVGGSNWIPADNFLTTLSAERYRAWLTLLKDGNQNMVRLWGGGIYEPDVFYDICDELGILVWQDFQFACGVYPAHDSFVESVRHEAEDNVKRLRRHPAMALFCGNNEDYQMVLQWGDVAHLPAVKLYEDVLPSVVSELSDPANPIPYHRGSPYGGKGWDTADPTVGDVHQWNIWGGKEQAWQEYDRMGGRFVSEFGIPAHPHTRTIEYWMTGLSDTEKAKQWHPQSKVMAQHCRAGLFERRFAILVNENFEMTSDLDTYVYNTQILQSEAVSYAYRSWRREWRGEGKEYCSGVLVWQLNDCWPVSSWAIADYFLRPKPAYYTIAREMKPVAVGIFRTVHKNRPNDRPRQFYEFGAYQTIKATLSVWGTNLTLSAIRAKLEITFVDMVSDWIHVEVRPDVELRPNQTTEIVTDLECVCPPDIADVGHASSTIVIGARLLDDNGEVLARYADWPQPYKMIDFLEPGVSVETRETSEEGMTILRVSVQKPVKGLVFVGSDDARWSDNALDVMPGDPQLISVTGLNGATLKAAYMGQEKGVLVEY